MELWSINDAKSTIVCPLKFSLSRKRIGLQSNLCGDRYRQGDRYKQVNFAENIRQLKILGSCPASDRKKQGHRYIQGHKIEVGLY